MNRHVYIAAFVLALVLVAVAGWMVEGARWLDTGQRGRRLAPSY
jgi:hypothetical protein